MSARPGYSLVESIAALLSGAIACGGMAAMLRAEERFSRAREERLARLETMRITGAVLRRELSAVEPGSDLVAAGHDSVALRLFRGFAVVCGHTADGAALVAYSGERQPDAARDSLLPLVPGDALPLPLRSASHAPASCDAPPASPSDSGAEVGDVAAEPYAVDVGTSLVIGTPLLLFQQGTYALSASALRVRHGDEGRQPLTGEWLDDRGTSLVVQARADAAPAHVAATLRFRPTPATSRLRLPLLNAPAPGPAGLP